MLVSKVKFQENKRDPVMGVGLVGKQSYHLRIFEGGRPVTDSINVYNAIFLSSVFNRSNRINSTNIFTAIVKIHESKVRYLPAFF